VTSEPNRAVTAMDLSPFGRCPVADMLTIPDHTECAKAVHGFCKNEGYASGFGPVARSSAAPSTS
jgi:hypothetical protein